MGVYQEEVQILSMIKVLKPIHDRPSYSAPMAKAMEQKLYDLLFAPIFEILNVKAPKVNSLSNIKQALRAGRIFWQDGYFYGQFNAVVGKSLRDLGATFSTRKKAYKLDLKDLPNDIRTDVVIGKGMNQAKTEKILKHLEEVGKITLYLGAGNQAQVVMEDLEMQVIKTFKVLPSSITIPYTMTDKQRAEIQRKYTSNLDTYLNEWKSEQIERLREKAEKNSIEGYRADKLQKIVQAEFGVTQKKARFIARQETALFVSRYRQVRYTDAGVREYIWSTSKDERVRDDHKDLSGKKFSWDSPPIVDKSTGRRANPGEDFNCRCLALPTINLRGW